jgi:hypothetical protein
LQRLGELQPCQVPKTASDISNTQSSSLTASKIIERANMAVHYIP